MGADATFDGPWAPHFEGYVTYRRALGFKVCRSDTFILATLCTYLGERAPDALAMGEGDVRGYLSLHSGKAASTVRGRECMVRQFAMYLRAKGLDAWVLPESMITKANNGFVPYILTEDEVRRVFAACDEVVEGGRGSRNRLFYQVLFRLLYSTGMRVGEALGLGVGDVDLDAGTMTVMHGKGDVSRMVPYHPTLGRWLEGYAEARRRPGDSYFFESPYGGMMTQPCVWTRFTKVILPRAGIVARPPMKVTVHSLRHTFACHSLDAAARSGADMNNYLPLLSAYMGHRDIKSTELYLRLTRERFDGIISACHHIYDGVLGDCDA